MTAIMEFQDVSRSYGRAAPALTGVSFSAGCLGVRIVYDDWHAVIEGTPESVHRLLSAAFGPNDFVCASAPLEELFVELVSTGRERALS